MRQNTFIGYRHMSTGSIKGWAMNGNLWSVAQREFEKINGNWNTVGLDLAFKTTVNNKNGVYMITGSLPKTIYKIDAFDFRTPLYIGQSQHLQERFDAHCKGQTGSSKLFKAWTKYNLKFNYLIIEQSIDERDLSILTNDIEAILIKTFGPISNEKDQHLSYSFEDSEGNLLDEINYGGPTLLDEEEIFLLQEQELNKISKENKSKLQ